MRRCGFDLDIIPGSAPGASAYDCAKRLLAS